MGLFMDNKKLLGKRIQELRKQKGLRQEKLAELSGVEPTSISNIENGRNYPSFQTLENIINVLGINFTDVFQFEHQQPTEDLLTEISEILKNHPEKIQDFYKIVKALTS